MRFAKLTPITNYIIVKLTKFLKFKTKKMKKVILFFAVALALASCTSKSTTIEVETVSDSTVVATDSVAVDSVAADTAQVSAEL